MKFRTKEEITKICDELYAIAERNWQPSMGYEVLVKGGIVLGIAHEEETRIKEIEAQNEIMKELVNNLKQIHKWDANISRQISEALAKVWASY